MSQKNPIKFLDAYTKDDKDIFFGRDRDTAKLYEKVNQSKVVLLYGLSGTGKTSLIRCGLENRYESGQLLFMYIRRGNDIINSVRQSVSFQANSLIHPNSNITEALEILYFDYLKPVTLIFDQFEELFISGSYDEKQTFISTIEEIVKSDLKVKIIFSLREEYLAHMDEFEEKIPTIYDHRHRLEKMRHHTLEEVITRIAEKGGVTLEDKNVPTLIINNISDRKGNVELPYLQVYLDKLTRLGKKTNNANVFTTKLVEQAGELEDVLGDFLDEQINRIANQTGTEEAVNAILKQMITPDGTKRQLSFNDIKPSGKLSSDSLLEILKELELSRLIKLEDGIYELSHDSLAYKIAEKRTAEEIQLIEVIKFLRNAYNSYRQTDTLLDRKQLKYVEPFLERLDPTDDERKLLTASRRKEKTRKIMLWSMAATFVIIFLAAGYFWQYQRFQSFTQTANGQMENAEYNEARTNYLRALDVPVPNKKEAKDGLKRSEDKLILEPEFNKLINEGDGFFSLGINYYDIAFERYSAASALHYNDEEAEQIFTDKKSDAISKYIELAKIENEEGHTDIAFSHLSKAFELNNTDNNIVQLLNTIITSSTETNLRTASATIKSEYSEVIDALLNLLTKAETGQSNVEKYNLIRSIIGK